MSLQFEDDFIGNVPTQFEDSIPINVFKSQS